MEETRCDEEWWPDTSNYYNPPSYDQNQTYWQIQLRVQRLKPIHLIINFPHSIIISDSTSLTIFSVQFHLLLHIHDISVFCGSALLVWDSSRRASSSSSVYPIRSNSNSYYTLHLHMVLLRNIVISQNNNNNNRNYEVIVVVQATISKVDFHIFQFTSQHSVRPSICLPFVSAARLRLWLRLRLPIQICIYECSWHLFTVKKRKTTYLTFLSSSLTWVTLLAALSYHSQSSSSTQTTI